MSSYYATAFQILIQFLEELEKKTEFPFKYMIVGGILTPIYAEARQTQDIDVVIQMSFSEAQLMFLIDELKIKKFVPITNWEEIYQEGRQKFIQIMDPNNIVKIDLNLNMTQGKSTEMYELVKELSFPNRVRGKVLDLECWIQSKEDFILAKLLYKGYQDYKDALACWIRYQTELDIQFLEVSAKVLKVSKELHLLMQQKPVDSVFPD